MALSDTHPLLYQKSKCTICDGIGEWHEGADRIICQRCGGSGRAFTDLGLAVWELAQQAILSSRLERERDRLRNV